MALPHALLSCTSTGSRWEFLGGCQGRVQQNAQGFTPRPQAVNLVTLTGVKMVQRVHMNTMNGRVAF